MSHDIFEQAKEAGIHIRPEVRKYYPYFLNCVRRYGAEIVTKVLNKGQHEKYRLKFLKNKKDRYQMMQLLDLV